MHSSQERCLTGWMFAPFQWSEFHVVKPYSTDVCIQLDPESPGRAPRDFPPKARGVWRIQVSVPSQGGGVGEGSPGDGETLPHKLTARFVLSQELLWQSRLQSTERCRLWEDNEECLSQHESTSTGHEGQIQISFNSDEPVRKAFLRFHLACAPLYELHTRPVNQKQAGRWCRSAVDVGVATSTDRSKTPTINPAFSKTYARIPAFYTLNARQFQLRKVVLLPHCLQFELRIHLVEDLTRTFKILFQYIQNECTEKAQGNSGESVWKSKHWKE